MKVLIYTDSRGQHTPKGKPVYDLFAQRLAQLPGVDAEVVLCPMKWTTTIDFLDYLEDHPAENYDWVILYTGIVDWSPRPQSNAIDDLYHNPDPANLDNTGLNTREYAKKVVNDKKASFDALFGSQAMADYLANDLGVEYEGNPTVNMYGLEMARKSLLPKLKAIPNLIFINSNRFVPGWDGDFTRGRPTNIALTEQYSELFRDELGPERVIDLLAWDYEEVKTYTCDNLHLTREGSDWIYDKLIERLIGGDQKILNDSEIDPDTLISATYSAFGRPIQTPDRLDHAARKAALSEAGLDTNDKLATLIIGVRLQPEDPSRTQNLLFLLDWIDYFYGDLFDVLLLEQDSVSKISAIQAQLRAYVRHEFVFNPDAYNRGWSYNVAIKHFTDIQVVAMMDTDVLTGRNFVQEIIACHSYYKAVSPYANVYFTDPDEALKILKTKSLDHLQRENGVSKPTTIAGGILIMRRDAFLEIAGFEQYTTYGGEDRALDVVLLNQFSSNELRIAPYIYVHLFHPSGDIDRSDLNRLLTHLEDHYGCTVDKTLNGSDYIHKNCRHVDPEKTSAEIKKRCTSFADLELYSSKRALTINGHYVRDEENNAEKIFPPELTNLIDYPEREIYEAPPPDREKIRSLYNKFKGERCFIIGNGPSLNRHDLSLLEGEYTFGVNSFYYKTRETGYRPTFYVVEDNAVMKENIEEIRKFDAPYKFFPTNYKAMHGDGENVYFFKMNRGFYEKSSPNYCIPRFSTDAADQLFCGQSVTYINLQLAFFMGFTEVHLIGMDFDYIIPKEHVRNGDLILSTTDDPNHFHKDYFGEGKTWKDPKLDRVALNYKQAKLAYEAVGRKIYNATIGGKLEIFPRVDYEILLRGTKNKQKRTSVIAPIRPISKDSGSRNGIYSERTTPNATKAASAPQSATGTGSVVPRTAAQIRAARRAKLKRDPHLYFKDSRFPPFRLLRFLFKPTGVSRWQADMASKQRREMTGPFSFLPTSRRSLAAGLAALKGERTQLESALRAEIASLRRDLQAQKAELGREFALSQETQANALNAQDERFAEFREQIKNELMENNPKLQEAIAKLREEANARATTEDKEKQALYRELGALGERTSALKQEVDAKFAAQPSLDAELNALRTAVDQSVAANMATMREEIVKATEGVLKDLSGLKASLDRSKRISGPANAERWRVHDRFMSDDDFSRLHKEWLRPLGLFLSPKQLGYMAHHIALAEERCEGRMATTIQAAMLRSLALLSLQSEKIELLEIGTLFGIGAGTLYQVGTRAQKHMHLTLLDPLDGYYGQRANDDSTGVPVTRDTLIHNLRMLDIPETDYRIIQQLSTDQQAIDAVGDRSYDYVLVDGDHSLSGVTADFELYGPMVKPGGLIIFDDYATTDWPAIQAFVDEQVRPLNDWQWIGGEWRTGILRRKLRSTGKKA